ncbi:MAG: pyridoxamine kinase [Cellulosilyticaceae bacterium]
MMRKIAKVATIQDLSGYGRCSLSVVIPVLSCLGAQVCPVPTAVLSTHMGGFGKPALADLTDLLEDYMTHWRQLGLQFEAIYSGYLANTDQIHHVAQLIQTSAAPHALVVVDPVMGDQGKLYSSYNGAMIAAMKQLITKADLITPNWTEACFLLDRSYESSGQSSQTLLEMAKALSRFGPKQVIITGVTCETGRRCNIVYMDDQQHYAELPYEEIPMHYPGTGDLFASVLIGKYLQGKTLIESVKEASLFVKKAVEVTYAAGGDPKEGVLLEYVLGDLLERTQYK